MDANCAELQSTWHTEIPISAAMGIEIAGFAEYELIVRAGLEPNINLHGTAFAGSLYAVCALTGWGMAWLQLRRRSLDSHIVMSEGRIEYLKAIKDDIVCRCGLDPETHGASLAALEKSGRTTLTLVCTIDAGALEAVRFEGVYAIRKR